MNIYAPIGLKEIIELQLAISQSNMSFPLVFHELSNSKSELICEDKNVEVYTIPLTHRIYTNGFLFKEKPSLHNLDLKAIEKYPEIERCDYFNIKKGKDFITKNGTVIKNNNLVLSPKKLLSYAFCSDTSYQPRIIPMLRNVDLLYHEATFTEQHKELAIKTGHSTAKQAAKIAKKAKVELLVLGHFSSRYKEYSTHQNEAKEVFENTVLAEEGKILIVD